MRIYRVSFRDVYDEHIRYEYFSSKADAIRADAENKDNTTRDEIEEADIELNKKGVLFILNKWASHPDNG